MDTDTTQRCFLTGLAATVKYTSNRYVIDSPACGKYEVSERLAASVGIWDGLTDRLHILAAVARQYWEEGRRLVLHYDNIETIPDSVVVPNDPLEQIDEIVKFAYKKTSHAGSGVVINYKTDYPIAFAKDSREFGWLLQQSKELGYLKNISRLSPQEGHKDGDNVCNLTLEGWQRIDELRQTGRASNQAFVAMWFEAQMDEAWKEGIKPALEDTGWKARHMGELEHNEKIDDRTIAEIRRSDLLVADLTGQRQNVYFEAGFAMGLGIPVIYTCRENDNKSVHFDTRQYKYIPWTTPAELRQKLRERIEATGLAKTLRENTSGN